MFAIRNRPEDLVPTLSPNSQLPAIRQARRIGRWFCGASRPSPVCARSSGLLSQELSTLEPWDLETKRRTPPHFELGFVWWHSRTAGWPFNCGYDSRTGCEAANAKLSSCQSLPSIVLGATRRQSSFLTMSRKNADTTRDLSSFTQPVFCQSCNSVGRFSQSPLSYYIPPVSFKGVALPAAGSEVLPGGSGFCFFPTSVPSGEDVGRKLLMHIESRNKKQTEDSPTSL